MTDGMASDVDRRSCTNRRLHPIDGTNSPTAPTRRINSTSSTAWSLLAMEAGRPDRRVELAWLDSTYSQSFRGWLMMCVGGVGLLGHQDLGLLVGRQVETYEPACSRASLKVDLVSVRGHDRRWSKGEPSCFCVKPLFPYPQHVRTFTVSLRRGVDPWISRFVLAVGNTRPGRFVGDGRWWYQSSCVWGLHETVVRKSILERIRRVSRPSGDYGAVSTWSFDWGAVTQDGGGRQLRALRAMRAQETRFSHFRRRARLHDGRSGCRRCGSRASNGTCATTRDLLIVRG